MQEQESNHTGTPTFKIDESPKEQFRQYPRRNTCFTALIAILL